MRPQSAARSASVQRCTMLSLRGLQRVGPPLLRSLAVPHITPSARHYSVITCVATPEAPRKPKSNHHLHLASFASSAAPAAGVGIPYAQLSVGEHGVHYSCMQSNHPASGLDQVAATCTAVTVSLRRGTLSGPS
jgi:hypothetical protein